MRIVYSQEPIPDTYPSIFLAGPTPRAADVASWRPAALALLEQASFDGVVFSPELRDAQPAGEFDYDEQISWERRALLQASVVLFWVPRELQHMPAFTTNIEFGFVSERRQPLVLGFPADAPKMRYLQWVARERAAPVEHSLAETVAAAVALTLRRSTVHDLLPDASAVFGPVAVAGSLPEVLGYIRRQPAAEHALAAAYGMVAVAAAHVRAGSSYHDGKDAVDGLSRTKCELDVVTGHRPEVVLVTQEILAAAQDCFEQTAIPCTEWASTREIFAVVLATARRAVNESRGRDGTLQDR